MAVQRSVAHHARVIVILGLAAAAVSAAPAYGPDYGPTDFALPGAYATTNYYPVPASGTVRYVAPNVPKGSANTGTSFASPWNLYDALNGGKAGDDTTLILSGGVYRVALYTASGLSINRRLTVQPYLDQKVWLKGSTQLVAGAFAQVAGKACWYTSWPLAFTNILNQGANTHYYIDEAVNPIADDGGMVFDRSGQPLRQVPTLAELGPGRFWIDYGEKLLYVGDNPAGICPVEVSACTNGLSVSASAKAVTIRGLGLTHFAGRGIMYTYATGRVENCVAVWNGNYGMSMNMAAGSVVRGCTFACNGQSGVAGGGMNALFERNLYAYNNVEKFATDYNAAGHKAIYFASSNMTFRANVFERNYAMGLWLDCSMFNTLICDNVMRFNKFYGLHVEISHGNSVAFNTLYGNSISDILVQNAPSNRVYNNTLPDVLDAGLRVYDSIRQNTEDGAVQSFDPASAAAGNMWDTYTNHVANNIFSRGSPSANMLFRAHETVWPGQASFGAANAMVTLSKNNLYNRPDAASPLISARADLTAAVTNYTELPLFRQHYPGFENGSACWTGTDPFFRDPAARDYRARAGGAAIGAATPLPADLAARCGRSANIGYAGANAPWDEGGWRFDETAGQALDCVSTNNGTLEGTGSPPLPQRVPGKGRYALSFMGTNCVSFTTPLAHLNGALTVSAWVKPDRPPTAGRIIANSFQWYAYGQNRGWLLGNGSSASDEISFKVWSPAGTPATASCYNFFRDWSNRWVHVAGVFKPGEYVAIYTNGVLATNTATTVTSIGTTNTNLRIGMRSDYTGQGMWSGLIDEVRIFGAALGADEVAALMPVSEGCWHFDETDGLNKAHDSVNVNTGNVSNATYVDAGKSGRALSFNGTTAQSVNFTTNLMHLSNAVTVSAWVRPITPPTGGRIIANTFQWDASGKGQSRGWLLGNGSSASDEISFKVWSPAGASASTTSSGFFKTWSNRWVHVAGVFKPGEYVALYTNGVLATNNATTLTAIGYTNTNLRIGMRSDYTGQGMWSGLIDEVRIYDGVLSSGALVSECEAAPNGPPELVRIIANPSSCFSGDTVELGVDASDPDPGDRIARVEFYTEGALLGVCTHQPYRLLWKSFGDAGTHQVTAKVYDTRENVTSAGVTVELKAFMTEYAAGHWRFDETGGIYSYDSVGSARGTNYNFTGSYRVPGKLNGALAFNGANAYVGFGTNLAHLAGALTVSAWVKPDSPPTVGRVIANTFQWDASGKGQSRGWLLGNGSSASDEISFKVWSPAGASVSTTSSGFFKTWSNRWVHVAGVFKPGEYVALYTNGVLAATNATTLTEIGTTNTNFRIGMRSDYTTQGQWSGLIDEVRVFGAALPQDELDALCSVPDAQWRFEEADGYLYATNSLAADLFRGTVYVPAHRTDEGHEGRALTFDGSADRVSFTTNMAHLAGALTVSAWVKPITPPKIGRVIASTYRWVTAGQNRGWLLGNESGGSDSMAFKICSPAGASVSAASSGFFGMWSNKWVHVAGVFKPAVPDNGYVALYINGVLAATNATTFTAIGTTNTNLRIGLRADNTSQGQWSGLIDEVRLYEGALPLFAIRALSTNAPVVLPGILSAPLEAEEPAGSGSRSATILLIR